jgi:hypothetical protein
VPAAQVYGKVEFSSTSLFLRMIVAVVARGSGTKRLLSAISLTSYRCISYRNNVPDEPQHNSQLASDPPTII